MSKPRSDHGQVRDLLLTGSAEAFRSIVAETADGIVGIDESERIVLFNRAAEAMFGYSAAQAIGQPLSMLLPERIRSVHHEHLQRFHTGTEQARYMGARSNPLNAMRANSSEFPVGISIQRLETEGGMLMVAHVRDISERVELLQQQVLFASQDPLTGCLNRRAFLDRAQAIHGRRSDDSDDSDGYALLMMDLDHFKAVNDNYGHAIGDMVLQKFSQFCSATLRREDVFARWGGEEFLALLPGATAATARAVAERVRSRTEQQIIELEQGDRVHHTVSIGVVVSPRPSGNIDDVIRLADRALYRAKQGGRNRVVSAASPQPGLSVV